MYYLHCFELWHGNVGEEEDAESQEWKRNTHKLEWSSWCDDCGVSTRMKQGFGLIFKRFGWNFLLIESDNYEWLGICAEEEESSDQTS